MIQVIIPKDSAESSFVEPVETILLQEERMRNHKND